MIERKDLAENFWEKPLDTLSQAEWEALCDGCGKCCMNKLEDEDTGEVAFTKVACRLFDSETCRCGNYATRLSYVPECVVLTPTTLPDVAYFMPQTCAYRRLHEGKSLPTWHPLLTGDENSPHAALVTMRGWALSEAAVPEDDWEDHLIEEPLGPPSAL